MLFRGDFVKNKLMNILLGLILIFAGFLYMFKDSLNFNFNATVFLLIGVAFLISYIKNKNKYSIIPAVYLICFSSVNLFLKNTDIFSTCITSMFYFAPGILFLIWYLKNKKSGYLTLGCVFNAIGIDIILHYFINNNGISLLLLCIGLALLISYVLYGNYTYKGKLYLSLLVILFSVANLIDLRSYTKYTIPSILIVIGVAIIIDTLNNKKE